MLKGKGRQAQMYEGEAGARSWKLERSLGDPPPEPDLLRGAFRGMESAPAFSLPACPVARKSMPVLAGREIAEQGREREGRQVGGSAAVRGRGGRRGRQKWQKEGRAAVSPPARAKAKVEGYLSRCCVQALWLLVVCVSVMSACCLSPVLSLSLLCHTRYTTSHAK